MANKNGWKHPQVFLENTWFCRVKNGWRSSNFLWKSRFWSPQNQLEMSQDLLNKHHVLLPQERLERVQLPVKIAGFGGYKNSLKCPQVALKNTWFWWLENGWRWYDFLWNIVVFGGHKNGCKRPQVAHLAALWVITTSVWLSCSFNFESLVLNPMMSLFIFLSVILIWSWQRNKLNNALHYWP